MKHLKFSSNLFTFLFVISGMIYIGCQKEENKSGYEQKATITELRTTVTPTVENGTLKFESKDDVIKYMDEISEYLTINQTLPNNFSGFKSLYSAIRERDSISFNEDSYFIDDRLNSILNENYELIIGDRVFIKKNLDETWSVLKSDLIGLNKLRLKQPGDFFTTNDFSESFIMENGDKIEQLGMPACKAKIRIIDTRVPEPEVPLVTTENGISNYCVQVFDVSGGTIESITINWGDGTTTTGTFNQCHSYTTSGDFLITVSVKMSCNSTPFTSSRLVSPFTTCCKLKSKDKKDVIIGAMKMVAEYQRTIFLDRFYWKAKTSSRAAATHNPVLAKNTAHITALFRTFDFCNEISHEGDTDSCNSCKNVSVDLWHIENDNVRNKHADVVITCTMVRHGVTLSHTFVPNCE